MAIGLRRGRPRSAATATTTAATTGAAATTAAAAASTATATTAPSAAVGENGAWLLRERWKEVLHSRELVLAPLEPLSRHLAVRHSCTWVVLVWHHLGHTCVGGMYESLHVSRTAEAIQYPPPGTPIIMPGLNIWAPFG